jgi:transcriptional regulator with XRE-family HTH domain
MDDQQAFGRLLHQLRKARDLTQAALSRSAGCAVDTIKKIEAGVRRPSRRLAELLADLLALEGTERAVFLQAARAELSPDRLTTPTQLVAPILPGDFPPLKTLDRRLGGMPAQPTPFIGRDTERMLLRVLLRRADVRLLTLSGPGGTGKTRLALQMAADLHDDFADGVVFVGLAAISDPALVLPMIAKALDLIDSGDQPLITRVSDALHDQRLLLLLDNFEQVLPAAPDVAALLAAAPSLKVLATSRAALHISWEREFPVPPLAVPNRGMLPSLDQLPQYDAVALRHARTESQRQLCARCGKRSSRGGNLPPARRAAAGDRVSGCANQTVSATGIAGPAGSSPEHIDGRAARSAGATADPARNDRVELQFTRPRRADAVRATERLRGRLYDRGG